MKMRLKSVLTAMTLLIALMVTGCSPEEEPNNGGGDNNGGGNGGGNDNTEVLINGHAYVDMGLPSGLLWATCNIGAERAEEYGEYYSWGETQTKETYDDWRYKYLSMDDNDVFHLTKYCDDPSCGYQGYTDTLHFLEPVDDVAAVNWGEGWHVPSFNDMVELLTHCMWSAATQDGVKGFLFTASNGGSLFFPAAGCKIFQILYFNEEGEGFYWLNQNHWNDPMKAWSFNFDPSIEYFPITPNTESNVIPYNDRAVGFTVRPVHAALKK